ncbi:hypothetical protein [Nocardia cyriacigeorgica]|uniref:hypothetical protein n=1 Tax=Nocardia cyriacigeorgica TaxID=135487 RepID=UPI0024559222|nr:hypothetical protein [Nocardia cyriacigeorgica]
MANDYRNPNCYLNLHGGCSTKISGEHYVSHGLIKLYTFDDPTAKILHDNGFGIPYPVAPKKFVAKVLCTNHNKAMSPADSAALKFAEFLRGIALQWLNGNGEWGNPEEIDVSGDDFQRWVLKLLATHAAASAFSDGSDRVTTAIPDEAVHLLLDKAAWPRTWGICVAAKPGNEYLAFDPFTKLETVVSNWWSAHPFFKTSDKSLRGGVVELAGVGFGLSLFNQGRNEPGFDENPDNPLRGSLQRPAYMEWTLNGIGKRVNFVWQDNWQRQGVTFAIVK